MDDKNVIFNIIVKNWAYQPKRLNHDSGQKFQNKNVILLIVEKFAYFFKGSTYDSGQSSKYLSNLRFCKKTLVLSFDDVIFSKGSFLDYKDVILL